MTGHIGSTHTEVSIKMRSENNIRINHFALIIWALDPSDVFDMLIAQVVKESPFLFVLFDHLSIDPIRNSLAKG